MDSGAGEALIIVTMKGNGYRKLYYIDRFARYMYPPNSRLRRLRREKRESKRAVRREMKKIDF